MANRIDDNRLLPCPFCGEDAAIWYFPQHDRPLLKEAYYVGCTNDNCGCEMEHPGGYKSLDDAVSAWNRRHKAPEQEPILDKLKAEIERQEEWLIDAGYNLYNVHIAFNAIKLMIDKYNAESKLQESER